MLFARTGGESRQQAEGKLKVYKRPSPGLNIGKPVTTYDIPVTTTNTRYR